MDGLSHGAGATVRLHPIAHDGDDEGGGVTPSHPPPAATYNVLSSTAALAPSGLPPGSFTGGGTAPMRFSVPSSNSNVGGGLAHATRQASASYQASQAAHIAQVREAERAERNAARAAKEARTDRTRQKSNASGGFADGGAAPAMSPLGGGVSDGALGGASSGDEGAVVPRLRKHSLSISSKSHKTDMNGFAYDNPLSGGSLRGGGSGMDSDDGPPPVAPPLSSLHRSPSFDKRLIESARTAGSEGEEEEEMNELSCAGVLAGSCCAPTSSSSHSHSHNLSPFDSHGRPLTKEQMQAQQVALLERRRGWYLHWPTWTFVGKCLVVILLVLGGVLLSVFLFAYLHEEELNKFSEQLQLLCLERSNTIQSHLNFSTTVISHYRAYLSLIKDGDPTNSLQPFASLPFINRYAGITATEDSINFLLMASVLRTVEQARRWNANVGVSIATFGPPGITRRNYSLDTLTTEQLLHGRSFIMPVDVIVPEYKPINLIGWDVANATAKIAGDSLLAARLNAFICSNRSSLLQSRNQFGLIVVQPLFADALNVPETPDEREAAWIGAAIGIIPMTLVVERAMATLDPQPIELVLLDRSAPDNITLNFLYHYTPDKTRFNNSTSTLNATTYGDENEAVSSFFSFGQRDFQVRCIPSHSFVNSAYSSTPLIIAVACAALFGVLLIIAVLGCLYASMRRAIARSTQLARANRNKNLALDLLHEAKRISDDANRSKSDFLAFLCHELRNPLHAIVAMIDFLQSPDDGAVLDPVSGLPMAAAPALSASQQECIDTIHASAKMMTSIVSDALDLSKIESGKITFEILRFNFAELVTSLSQCEKPRAQAKGIQLLLNIDPNVPLALYGDPTRIRQVCTNLLSNSIKFTSKGYVLISLSKVSLETFSLPMMGAVEEAGESKFQSDLSRTAGGAGGHTVLGRTTTGANSDHSTTGHGLGGLAAEYMQAPGSTPAIAQRRLGGGTGGVEQIEEDATEEDDALLQSSPVDAAAASQAPNNHPSSTEVPAPSGSGTSSAISGGDIELTSPQLTGVRAPVLSAQFDYSSQRTLTDNTSGGSGAPASGPAVSPLPEAPKGLPATSSSASSAPPPNGSGSLAASVPGTASGRSKKPFTHVPLQPSAMPASGLTLIDLDNSERPAALQPANSSRDGSGVGGAGGTGPGSRVREPSSRASSSATTFASENVIIEISVTDTGMGIDPAALPLLFEPYSQAKLSVMRNFGGTGLGLAIVKQIVEMMQGSISVKSQVGEGTTMTIRLPLPTAPPFDSSSGEVSETSHTHASSKGQTHSRSQQDGMARRSGSAPAQGLAVPAGAGDISLTSNNDGTHSPPTALSSIAPLPSLRGAPQSAPTPGSSYGTMESRSVSAPAQQQRSSGGVPLSDVLLQMARDGSSGLVSTPQTLGRSSMSLQPYATTSMPLRSIDGQLSAVNTPFLGGSARLAGRDGDAATADDVAAAGGAAEPSRTESDDGDIVFHEEGEEQKLPMLPQAPPPVGANGVSEPAHAQNNDDVRSRLAALAFPAASATSSAGAPPTYRPSKPRHAPPAGLAAGLSSSPAVAAAAQAASKKSVATALASMVDLTVEGGLLIGGGNSKDAATVGSSSKPMVGDAASGSLVALAANRSSQQVVHPRDLRILIADDSLTNLKILSRMLQGFHVTQAVNGLEAVERVKELILADPPLQPFGDAHDLVLPSPVTGEASSSGELESVTRSTSGAPMTSPFTPGFSPTPQAAFVKQPGRQFHVIFSDVIMPVMDGQQAAREIRQLERLYHLPPVPLVALTANAFLEDRNKCAAAGFSLFVAKPFNKNNILSIVQLVCQQNGMVLATGAAAGGSTGASSHGHKSHSAQTSPNLANFLLVPPPGAPAAATSDKPERVHSASAATTPAPAHSSLTARQAVQAVTQAHTSPLDSSRSNGSGGSRPVSTTNSPFRASVQPHAPIHEAVGALPSLAEAADTSASPLEPLSPAGAVAERQPLHPASNGDRAL